MTTVIVLDFETTGMSPAYGDRVTEVGAVLIENGRILDSFQSLVNAGVWISPFIEQLTGITNAMIRKAPPIEEVMEKLARFVGNSPLVAHNAAFDRKFLDAELAHIGRACRQEIACSMLISRRVFPDAPSHSLGELVRYANLPTDGVYHRALADATMTAHLWLRMQTELRSRYGLAGAPFELMRKLQQVPKRQVADYMRRLAEVVDRSGVDMFRTDRW